MTQDQAAKNEKAVTRAVWTLRAYVNETQAGRPTTSRYEPDRYRTENYVSELLADLMHYCHGGRDSFEDCLKTARINFKEETSQ